MWCGNRNEARHRRRHGGHAARREPLAQPGDDGVVAQLVAVVDHGQVIALGTPRELIAKINNDMNRIMKMPDVTQRLAGDGVEAVGTTAEQFGIYLRSEIVKWGKVVKASGAKVD